MVKLFLFLRVLESKIVQYIYGNHNTVCISLPSDSVNFLYQRCVIWTEKFHLTNPGLEKLLISSYLCLRTDLNVVKIKTPIC